MNLTKLQQKIEQVYKTRELSEQPSTLTLGAMEELGELSELILFFTCSDYRPNNRKILKFLHDTQGWKTKAAYEIGDVITYLLALCNVLGIEPIFSDELKNE